MQRVNQCISETIYRFHDVMGNKPRTCIFGWFFILLIFVPAISYGQALTPGLTTALNQMGMVPFTDHVQSATFDLQDHNGNPVSLSDFSGQVVMVNFWATWCGPCRTEMPSMQRMYNSFRDRGFVMLAVNSRENPRVVAQFIEEFGYTFPVALDINGRVSFQYGVRSIPLTYLIDPTGRIIAGKPGAQEWDAPRIFQGLDQVLQIYGK
jgi:peroxiredoxin